MNFDLSLNVPYGRPLPLSPLVSKLLLRNPGPFTFKGSGVHIVGAGREVAIIDPGPDRADQLEMLKAALGPRQISHILVTHTHQDHCAAARALKAWSGAPIYGPVVPAPAARDDASIEEAHDRGFLADIVLEEGMQIQGSDFLLECVATPGHTANHMCFALGPEQALFSGDHVMSWSTSVIAPPDGDMGQYLASLAKLLDRDDKIFYPTHGSPIVAPRAWLGQLIDHRHARETQILTALDDGCADLSALVERLYPAIAANLRAAAAQQVKAHLDLLAQKGAVSQEASGYRLRTGTARRRP